MTRDHGACPFVRKRTICARREDSEALKPTRSFRTVKGFRARLSLREPAVRRRRERGAIAEKPCAPLTSGSEHCGWGRAPYKQRASCTTCERAGQHRTRFFLFMRGRHQDWKGDTCGDTPRRGVSPSGMSPQSQSLREAATRAELIDCCAEPQAGPSEARLLSGEARPADAGRGAAEAH
jgi:hypothetical protein